jgi:UDP-N-acetylglucosamine diphosphorylase / glucose-1-phosphate thymidylyltransferase / UDP-N-acetylgalactosamine diphosphorylase / glucosamine-1-phosphate N-acetyltransferase / galactosamine-1-phosphate N-acetyltransferase
MIKNLIVLAAGSGTKIWPYSDVRNKTMIPIANKPILAYNIESALELGVENIVIVTGKFSNGINHYFSKYKKVKCINTNSSDGPVDSLLAAEEIAEISNFAVLYGDTIIQKNDLSKLLSSNPNSILVSKLREATGNVIGTCIENGKISGILGHPREDITHRFAGFHFSNEVLSYLKNVDDFMHDLQVGMMPAKERYIEAAVADMIRADYSFSAIETEENFYDIDKPWHILEANEGIVTLLCSQLTKNELAEGASIDNTADLRGFVKLGKGSKIGRNVIIEGNIIVGDNTTIDNGAILNENIIIDDDVYVGNYCFISSGSSIGRECFLGHACEFWGLLMKRIYLYHYMEMFGIIGENTDIGAGTVCGTLRFDDGNPTHTVKGKKEIPYCNSEAIYLGDYSRTGVNAIILPGIKTGVNSLVGPGVVLSKDLPNRKAVFVKQELEIKDWSPDRYGW